jgi:uncharacterized protein YbjT (DUF2867 family)
MTHNNDRIVVIGATGKTGRRVAERLRRRSITVRGASRSSAPPFDWTDESTWTPALQGASAAYITYFPDIAVPGAPEVIAALAEVALAGGTRRLVLLSGRGESEAQRAEQLLQASGADWTVLRASWFMQNFSESIFLEPLLDGELALPAGTTGEPFVDADDIADVAIAALTEPGHVGATYELTGPRLLTFEQAVDEIVNATGRALRYVPITPAEHAAAMDAAGVPDDVAALVSYLFGEVLDGRNAVVADGVPRALGRAPRDFAEFARDAAATGVWSPR